MFLFSSFFGKESIRRIFRVNLTYFSRIFGLQCARSIPGLAISCPPRFARMKLMPFCQNFAPFLPLTVHLSSQAFSTDDDDIFIAIKHDDNTACRASLVSNPDSVNLRHPRGWTPLMAAVVQHKKRIAITLLECGADINAVDEYNGNTDSGEDRFFADLNSDRSRRFEEFSGYLKPDTDYRGCTALHYAVLVDDEALVELLLQSGADPGMENIHGHMPIDLCKSPSIARLLGSSAPNRRRVQRQPQPAFRIPLEQRLRDNIVGQNSAIEIVTSAIQRKEKGWHDDEHPLVMLFMGSSGVGKTEVAKQVAAHLHSNNPRAFIRLDMSEYQEKHEVSKLFGAPPGYVGYDNGGQLTNTLMHYPNAVVLFDEIEKAHPDVMTALLQLFDEVIVDIDQCGLLLYFE
ncbi:unnamed protein product [Hymenolepis diminuta]|uniref:AAA+ ATPase domain-containing protein n=1 Tax=Hymenolepis diminuta TaxID=6216 RepID=A0A564Z4F0_HYMDI|nr:unnamed protein product [Hymenolepis diminuta]